MLHAVEKKFFGLNSIGLYLIFIIIEKIGTPQLIDKEFLFKLIYLAI